MSVNFSSDSDSEFERYMQDSFSSSIASSLSVSLKDNRQKKSNDNDAMEEISALGMNWLKSPTVTSDNNNKPSNTVQVPSLTSKDLYLPQGLLEDEEEVGGVRLSTSSGGRRLSQISRRSSVTDDPLNFSQSSGVSLLSELEHQLGLRSSRSRTSPSSNKPGEETLAEEEDKKRFFEELERGKDGSLDYSELNRQLSNTNLSMRGGLMSTNQLKTIDENATPHISDDDDEANLSSHTHLPTVTKIQPTNDSSSMSDPSETSSLHSSSGNLPLPSPLHSSSSHSITNKPNTKLKSPPNKSPLKSPSIDKLEPITENASEKLVRHLSHDKDTPLSTVIEGALSSTGPAFGSDTGLRSIQPSTSLSAVPMNSKSTGLVKTPFNTQKQTDNVKSTTKSNKKSTSLQEVAQMQSQWSDLLIDNKSSDVMSVSNSHEPAPSDPKERSLGELLRSLATEELTHDILSEEKGQSAVGKGHKGQEESDSSDYDGSSTVTEHENVASSIDEDSLKDDSLSNLPTVHVDELTDGVKPHAYSSDSRTASRDDVLTKAISSSDRHSDNFSALIEALEFAKADLSCEKKHVTELENMLMDKERQTETAKSEYTKQIKELRTQLLDMKSKLRKIESEKRFNSQPNLSALPQDKEQERLIYGYQKENEKLYTELAQIKKEYKMTKSELNNENSRQGSELANLRVKSTAQEETIRQLKEQLSRYKSYTGDQGKEKYQLLEKNNETMQAQMEILIHEKEKLSENLGMKEKSLQGLKAERDEIASRHLEHISLLKTELESVKEALKRESELNGHKLRKKNEEINALRDEIKNSTNHHHQLVSSNRPGGNTVTRGTRKATSIRGKAISGPHPHPIQSRSISTNDSQRIKELEGQVEELYSALKESHPNSIPVLMHACASMDDGSTSEVDKEVIEYLENRVRSLEKQLLDRDAEERRKMEEFEERFKEMEKLYDDQISSLMAQLKEVSDKHGRYHHIEAKGITSSPMKDENRYRNIARDLRKENKRLKEKLSEFSLELSHLQVQLKGCVAEHESEKRKTNEEWESRMKQLEDDHKLKVDQLYESFVNNHTIPDIERLKTKLEGRETKIRMLEEELSLVKSDGEILAVLKAREEEMRQQIEVLNKELLEAKKHHTPEMHHYNSLLAKISLFESRQTAYQQKMSDAFTGHVTQEDLDKMEHHYKKKLVDKDRQLEKFRNELEEIMDKLYTLQEGNVVMKQLPR